MRHALGSLRNYILNVLLVSKTNSPFKKGIS
jgi:hypothetical protein